MFESDRTCCVCRQRAKRVQIHHIDSKNTNDDPSNLAVLCLECHTETQVGGGFFRKLDAVQVTLYRDSWLEYVASGRRPPDQQGDKAIDPRQQARTAKLMELVEIAQEQKSYATLVNLFDMYNKIELRDKYIELLLTQDGDIEAHIYYRSMQKRLDLLDQKKVDDYLAELESKRDWQRLARQFKALGKALDATRSYCKHILEAMEERRMFNVAYILRELGEAEFYKLIFEEALKQSREQGDLYWQIRALEELEWFDELRGLLEDHRHEIEDSSDRKLYLLKEKYFSEADGQ